MDLCNSRQLKKIQPVVHYICPVRGIGGILRGGSENTWVEVVLDNPGRKNNAQR